MNEKLTNPAVFGKKLPLVIIWGWLIAGTLDALAAILNFLLQGGKNPANIFKYIASAAFGKKAFTAGNEMVIWGIGFHYMVALWFTLFFVFLFIQIKWIRQHSLLSGIGYGLLVWLIMNRVVVPLSLAPQPAFLAWKAIINMLILVLCIGIPLALVAKKYYLYKK